MMIRDWGLLFGPPCRLNDVTRLFIDHVTYFERWYRPTNSNDSQTNSLSWLFDFAIFKIFLSLRVNQSASWFVWKSSVVFASVCAYTRKSRPYVCFTATAVWTQ